MYIILTILIVIVAILLVLIVVVQNSKGGGLAAGFASSNQVMGVRKTTDFLEKATWWLAGIVVALCVIATIFSRPSAAVDDSGINEMLEKTASPDVSTPPPFETPMEAPVAE
ncbi:MAG: preprotein translocase subunit SecG [Candidatus Symbiothrix sp.]|jgi:preprotein translocase subunit SecG|nr:preprotein translocase subunit SecG [Candidatus Symbiothrix sp.]